MSEFSLTPRQIDTRAAGCCLGVDFGSDARVLAINGLVRLVWALPSRYNSMPGCHGGGGCMSYVPASLVVRRFRPGGDRLIWDDTVKVFEAGRLSKARLLASKDLIDAHLGAGVTQQLDPRFTLLCGPDSIGDYIADYRRRLATIRAKPNPLMLQAQALTTFDGIRL